MRDRKRWGVRVYSKTRRGKRVGSVLEKKLLKNILFLKLIYSNENKITKFFLMV